MLQRLRPLGRTGGARGYSAMFGRTHSSLHHLSSQLKPHARPLARLGCPSQGFASMAAHR